VDVEDDRDDDDVDDDDDGGGSAVEDENFEVVGVIVVSRISLRGLVLLAKRGAVGGLGGRPLLFDVFIIIGCCSIN